MRFNRGMVWARERDIEEGVQRPPFPERPDLPDEESDAEDTEGAERGVVPAASAPTVLPVPQEIPTKAVPP
eukprot:14759071-Alexandrium_andersonii.AAC.1